jgi:lysozyme
VNDYTLDISDLSITKHAESCRLIAFKPIATDPWTIGWGHTGADVFEGMVWTQFKADSQLLVDMSSAEQAVKRLVKVSLSREQFIALCDLVYNIGEPAFSTSTLLRRLNLADWEGTIAEFARWNLSAGHVYAGLTLRRSAEKAEFILGTDYSAVVPSAS